MFGVFPFGQPYFAQAQWPEFGEEQPATIICVDGSYQTSFYGGAGSYKALIDVAGSYKPVIDVSTDDGGLC